MVREEALWIRGVLERCAPAMLKEVLDVGSSTRDFRCCRQPYIEEEVFLPLQQKGIHVYHLDAKAGEGIDYACDVNTLKAEELGRKFDLVICANLLEHVTRPEQVALLLKGLVKEKGFLLVSVPGAYRYHPDPIDTRFRPSMQRLLNLFDDMEIVDKKIVRIKDRERYRRRWDEQLRYHIPFLNWKINCLLLRKR
ncbi:MAG: methyltransferase domain-containing protein [Candidatus Omnitrophica bacterium]|nr:methyltransferase domain-containing protein [Candidatus Omnitrophota bacterium]MBU4477596.1 methyltransferase domain-containing protein [Candidatus Omnitrophota bacterium]MCG2702803.1 methyltransferase domain-containing protein [Candidatus Omnitrophota bacterium]